MKFNAFDGAKVVSDLEDWKYRTPWVAVLMDQFINEKGYDLLIKLRDLHRDYWNVDTLFILVETEKKANWWEHFATKNWNCDTSEILSRERTAQLLGLHPPNHRYIVMVWWD